MGSKSTSFRLILFFPDLSQLFSPLSYTPQKKKKEGNKLLATKCQQNIRLTYFAILLPLMEILGGQSPGSWLSRMEKVTSRIFATRLLVSFRLNSCNFQVSGAPSLPHLFP